MSRKKTSPSAAGPGSGRDLPHIAGSAEAPEFPIERDARALRRRRGRWIAGTVVAAAIATGAAWYAFLPVQSPATAATPVAAAVAVPRYVGVAACTVCHAKEHAAWKGSDHDLAMQVADDKTVLGNFANVRFSYAGTTSTFFRRDGRFFVNTDGPDGKLADFEVKYAFGVRPLQQYLVEFPGGRMQALGIAWDSRPKAAGGQRWFHLYPGQNVKAGDWLHWTSVSQNWNFQCAECHSTNLRKNFDAKSGTFSTAWSEINVACESCHGPASNHVAWARKQGAWQAFDADKGLALALDERRGITWAPVAGTGHAIRSAPRQSAREIEMCARCHGRAGRLSDDYMHGKPPLDTHRLARLDDDLYWNDGQMRDEVYNWGSFVQSRMYARGVTCADCHDPHSLKLREPGNLVCAQCHLPATYDTTRHTHHADGTPGAACAACHMPTTTYMVVDPRHDHSMRIPRPDLAALVGAPNACNNCHAKKSPQWAADAIRQWTGRAPASFQRFADALHAGSTAAPGARGALLTVLDDKSQPAIVRASAIDRLGRLLTPTTVDAVSRSLNDPEALVRLAAVEALANADTATRQRYLPRMMDDPVRAVRIEAAHALAGPPEAGLSPGQRAAFDRTLAEYVAVQTYNADRPEGRMSLGNLYALRGDPGGAIAEYRQAIAIDPTFVAAYVNLADLYRARGVEAEAEKTLREGLARNPRAAALHHSLGLVLVRQKRGAEGLAELRTASQLAPDDARFAYVYAVALHDAGQRAEALKTLDAALKRRPHERDLLSGLAFFSGQAGRREQALDYVKRLRELDPENPEYARMAKQLGGGTPP
jgi:tetratricopeptide (TPR) repeat protein